MVKDFKFYGYVGLFLGALVFLRNYSIIDFNTLSLIGAILTIVGLKQFYLYYGNKHNLGIVFGVFSFLFGVLIFVSSEFEITLDSNSILVTTFLSLAVAFLFLFLERKQFAFFVLFVGMFSITLLYVFIGIEIIKREMLPYIITTSEAILTLSVTLVIIGAIVLSRRSKRANL